MNDEYISKKQAVDLLSLLPNPYDLLPLHTIAMAIYSIENEPAADVHPVKHGRWKQIGEQSAKCTACGGVLKSNGKDKTGKALIFNAVYHYCPYCGARMDGDSECQ